MPPKKYEYKDREYTTTELEQLSECVVPKCEIARRIRAFKGDVKKAITTPLKTKYKKEAIKGSSALDIVRAAWV